MAASSSRQHLESKHSTKVATLLNHGLRQLITRYRVNVPISDEKGSHTHRLPWLRTSHKARGRGC